MSSMETFERKFLGIFILNIEFQLCTLFHIVRQASFHIFILSILTSSFYVFFIQPRYLHNEGLCMFHPRIECVCNFQASKFLLLTTQLSSQQQYMSVR